MKGFQIRTKTYRSQQGFLVIGPGGIFGTSIFTATRSSAEHIRAKCRLGLEITTADFAAR